MTASLGLMATGFMVAGVLHFIAPTFYARSVPRWLPSALLLVAVSGAFEIIGAVGILVPATRVAAGWGLIALLVAVFPANVQMWQSARAAHRSMLTQWALAVRLPLQGALIYWVFRTAVSAA